MNEDNKQPTNTTPTTPMVATPEPDGTTPPVTNTDTSGALSDSAPVEAMPTISTNETTPVVATPAMSPIVPETVTASQPQHAFAWKPYLWAAVAIAVIGVGLLFLLEQQGRINTSYFSNVTKLMEGEAASVNKVQISRADFDRNFEQVMREVATQGFGPELDPEMEATLKEQAIQSLVNAELLKQAAEAAGVTTDAEALEARLSEIEAGNGGPEQLAARMAEFGIGIEQLRIDVEREIMIQTHLNTTLKLDSVVVSDEEVTEVYNQVALENVGAEIPPLVEVTDLLRNQIISERQQQLIGEYIETLRQAAEIEINV